MKIKIFNSGRTETLPFGNEEEFNIFRQKLSECIADETNTKSLIYSKDGVDNFYPSLFIKSSLIEIIEKEPEPFVF